MDSKLTTPSVINGVSNESLGKQIASLHNLRFYLWLVEEARSRIIRGDFMSWKARIIPKLEKRL